MPALIDVLARLRLRQRPRFPPGLPHSVFERDVDGIPYSYCGLLLLASRRASQPRRHAENPAEHHGRPAAEPSTRRA